LDSLMTKEALEEMVKRLFEESEAKLEQNQE
jgi:hypothetical protein